MQAVKKLIKEKLTKIGFTDANVFYHEQDNWSNDNLKSPLAEFLNVYGKVKQKTRPISIEDIDDDKKYQFVEKQVLEVLYNLRLRLIINKDKDYDDILYKLFSALYNRYGEPNTIGRITENITPSLRYERKHDNKTYHKRESGTVRYYDIISITRNRDFHGYYHHYTKRPDKANEVPKSHTEIILDFAIKTGIYEKETIHLVEKLEIVLKDEKKDSS